MATTVWPGVNAALNGASGVLLLTGWWAIRRRQVALHMGCMGAALAVSLAFLASYLLYHAQVGSVRFPGTGWIRPVYFGLLISHTLLAVVIIPLAVRAVWLAVRQRFAAHVRIARWTLPLWLYVSASGIIVYWLLYRSPWGVT